MLLFEVKKVFLKPISKIVLLLLLILLIVVSYLAVRSVEYVDSEGRSTFGILAAKSLRKSKNQWAGYITEDVLVEVLEKNATINNSDEYLSKEVQENNKAYAKKQGFSDIREMINMAFGGFQDYDYYRADSVTIGEVGSFYTNRILNLKSWLNSAEVKDNSSESEKEFLINQYEKLNTPLYYEYMDGWNALLEYMPTLIMVLVLISGFLVSGIFSNEFQLKADSIFFSTKFGRNRAICSKIGAGFVIVTTIYWSCIFLYSMIVLAVLGTDGASCAIQTGLGGWKSFYNITCFQEYLLAIMGGYIGSLFILTLSMLISAKTRSTVLAVTIPFILLFIPTFLNSVDALSKVLGVLPDQLLQIGQAVNYFNLYQVAGRVVGAIPILFIVYVLLYGITLPLTYYVYRKSEIK